MLVLDAADPKSEDDNASLTLRVSLGSTTAVEPPAAAGFHVMELIRAAGLPIKAECGGAGVCATCHIRVPEAWAHLLPEPSEEERQKLDEIPSADDTSRLACQLLMTHALDGLEVALQPDSIILPSSQGVR